MQMTTNRCSFQEKLNNTSLKTLRCHQQRVKLPSRWLRLGYQVFRLETSILLSVYSRHVTLLSIGLTYKHLMQGINIHIASPQLW